jgi:phosphonate transport system ATP-binding protein
LNLELVDIEARHPAARDGAPAALQKLSLSIAAGEQVAVIGPSGAGKTSLLQVAAAALKPGFGQVKLGGENPWALSGSALQRLRGRLFLAPQTPPLPPRQRVVTSVLAGRLPAISLWESLRSLFYPTDIEGAHRALTHFDLAEKLFDRVDRLSGGERQRIGLARALLSPASLWLIDEPLSALDPTRAQQAITQILGLAGERGITVLATLHQVDMALAHFSRIVGLRDGQLAFDLPRTSVTQAHLKKLYAHHEDELNGPAPGGIEEPSPPPVVLMSCR